MTLQSSPDKIEHGIGIEAFAGIKPVVRCPVLLMPVLGPEQSGDGVTPKPHQTAEHVPAGALKGLGGAKQIAALSQHLFQRI